MIPLVDLKAQYQTIKHDVDAAVISVLESGQYVLGPEVDSFEREFANYCGVDYAVGVNSGTSALHIALLAAGVGPGDEVITVPFTFVATAAAIVYTGATPVFVDIDPATFNIDPALIEDAITPRTKAILPVHLYGQAADMDPILDIARRHKLIVIEDACQAHGAEYEGRRTGGLGDIGCFSFYPSKNLGAYGEGGALTTNSLEFAEKCRMLRDWGAVRKYEHQILGFNYRLPALQAAILRVKLRHLEEWNERRRAHAADYNRLLGGMTIRLPAEDPGCRSVRYTYVIRSGRRDALASALSEQGIATGVHFPAPIHLQPPYKQFGSGVGSLPCSEIAAGEVLSLPMYPELTKEQIESVAAAVRTFERNEMAPGSELAFRRPVDSVPREIR